MGVVRAVVELDRRSSALRPCRWDWPLQTAGAGIAASTPDAHAVTRRDSGCCLAEYLDQPVGPYTVDESLDDGQVVRLGDADWAVVRTPGHTPGNLSV
jgi:glyoxylase-like metal-dependent hydrolase (beta-lactamase superfamily II)